MLQGPARIWEGAVGRAGGSRGVGWGRSARKGTSLAGAAVPSLEPRLSPQCLDVRQMGASLQGLPSRPQPGGGQGPPPRCPRRPPRCPAGFQLPPLPRPPSPRATSLSVLVFQSCTRRELSMGGWFFGFLFSVGLFNLMICKVMSLFLFYTFLLIFNLCLEDDSCNCTFFCLLTRINDNFVLGGCMV